MRFNPDQCDNTETVHGISSPDGDDRDKLRNATKELRDTIMDMLRAHGGPLYMSQVTKRLGITSQRVGSVVGRYPSYLVARYPETWERGTTAAMTVDLHPHIKEKA